MKNLLTIVVSCETDTKHASTLYSGIELIYPQENENQKDFIVRAIKSASGKYSVLLEQKFMLADIGSLLNALDKNSPDMLIFAGGTAIKTSIVKTKIKQCTDIFSLFMLSALDCKTLLRSTYMPFSFDKSEVNFDENNYTGLLIAAEAFVACKSKLGKDIYSHTLNAMCSRLVVFYITAMLAIRDKKLDSQKLVSFDNKLKGEIFLYLALEKKFTLANLTKLRKREFKISFFTAKKFKKVLKSQ